MLCYNRGVSIINIANIFVVQVRLCGRHWCCFPSSLGAVGRQRRSVASWLFRATEISWANTISRAELAAIATAVTLGYSHIATDSLTSLHQIKKQLSHPNLNLHHIQGDVLQSIAKAIRQSPSPIHFFQVKSHAGIIGNNMPTSLLKSQPPPTPTLQTPPSKQEALRGIPSTTSTGLQKKT
jgi:hypothetical protein